MPVELKIKIKSLADEARIIRQEEHKLKKAREYAKLNSVHLHRVINVRQESRATHLAYGYLRGKPYKVIENKSKSDPNFDRIKSMVKKYGNKDLVAGLDDWFSAGGKETPDMAIVRLTQGKAA